MPQRIPSCTDRSGRFNGGQTLPRWSGLKHTSCAAGYNIRWLLRAITRLGLRGLFLVLSNVAAYAVVMPQLVSVALGGLGAQDMARQSAPHRLKSVAFAVAG